MVFSSIPVYLDPHNNWQQQQPDGGIENNQLPPSVPLLPPPVSRGGGSGTTTTATATGTGSIRPGSMAERARMAKLPQPDQTALKCPRCESSNTKFCYFNNYSLTQPRHFCKTCRRYWTRGGALRNVPVGGGCRRNNKRSKKSRSKSPHPLERRATSDVIGHFLPPPPQLPILPSLPHLGNYGSNGDLGLNFTRISQLMAASSGGGNMGTTDMEFQIGSSSCGGGGGGEQWRFQQVQNYPFLAGLDHPQTGIYPFGGESVTSQGYAGELGSKALLESAGVGHEAAAVKIEENQGVNLSRNFLGLPGNDQYWGGHSIGNAWTDLSGFTSTTSSTSHLK